ncbi:hypothetical protein [Microbacterium sp. CJ88]|uniref:hypothetical protein n=1 Tax=Microbacterium sp. CJ88 TaxID=3445672 RepID=UPI003F658569
MTPEQFAGLITATAVLLTAVGGTIAAIAAAVRSFRRSDSAPAPEVGIPATAHDDIDYRAYADLKEQLAKTEARAEKAEHDRDYWMHRALGIDEDTRPQT